MAARSNLGQKYVKIVSLLSLYESRDFFMPPEERVF